MHRSTLCGGTIISKNVILTAAHCVPQLPNVEIISMTATIGNSNPDAADAKTINVHSVLLHPKHKIIPIKDRVFILNDLALVRLEKDLNFNNNAIQPINLPVENYSDADLLDRNKTKLLVVGWGRQQKLSMLI